MVGQVTKYMVANGMTQFDQNVSYNDVSPYSSFDGDSMSDIEFAGEGDLMDFSNASGRRKKKKRSGSTIKSRTEARQKARLDRKDRKLKIKESETDTQKKVAEDLSKEDPETQKLMETLANNDAKTPDSPKGMSKGLKIGLIVGGVVLAGVIAFVVIRKMKNKSKK
jgi:hypothetical protein